MSPQIRLSLSLSPSRQLQFESLHWREADNVTPGLRVPDAPIISMSSLDGAGEGGGGGG